MEFGVLELAGSGLGFFFLLAKAFSSATMTT